MALYFFPSGAVPAAVTGTSLQLLENLYPGSGVIFTIISTVAPTSIPTAISTATLLQNGFGISAPFSYSGYSPVGATANSFTGGSVFTDFAVELNSLPAATWLTTMMGMG